MSVVSSHVTDYIERYSRILTLAAFATAILSIFIAPLLAFAWRNQPFAGFFVEQTMVVNRIGGQGWSGKLAGIDFPQQVTRVAGRPVSSPEELQQTLAAYRPGDHIPVFTRLPDGSEQLFPDIQLMAFDGAELIRLFWLPYLVGLVYLGIGGWIYRLRGKTRAGKALAFFCIVTSITCVLMFDIYTTHALAAVWIVAVANIGGALVGLAWQFPEEWSPVRRRPLLVIVPYLISIALAIWGVLGQMNLADPWAYLSSLGACYRYAAFGILMFFGVMLYRARSGASPIVRRQARLVAVGSVIAFSPIMFWLAAPLFRVVIVFEPMLFLPGLLLFPISVALAILRYRLWEVDTLVNRAFVYGLLTAILAGVFAALIGFTQKMFLAVTGEESDAAIVITTLIVAAAITPLKSRVETFVDRQFRDSLDDTNELVALGEQVRAFVQMSDVTQITQSLLMEAVQALKADSGAVSLLVDGHLEILHTFGSWKNDAYLSVTLDCGKHRHGILQLGPHQAGHPYGRRETEILQQVADQVARAVCLALPRYNSTERPTAPVDWNELINNRSKAPAVRTAIQGQKRPISRPDFYDE